MSTAVEQATELIRRIMEEYGMDLIGVLLGLSEEINKEIEVTIRAVPGQEDAEVTMTVSKVREEAAE